MFKDQKETIDGRSAKVFTGQRDLAVSIFVDILNKTMATVKTASDSFNDPSHGRMHLTPTSGNFPLNILKNNSYHPDYCNNKRSKQQTSHLITDSPPVSLQNTEITSLVSIFCEVPRTDSNN